MKRTKKLIIVKKSSNIFGLRAKISGILKGLKGT